MPPFDLPTTLIDTGFVVQAFPDQETYTVQSTTTTQYLQGCASIVGGLFAPFFGFKSHMRLPVGTKVLLLNTSPALILSCIPTEPANEKSGNLHRTTTGTADIEDLGSDENSADNIHHSVPKDLLEGEFSISNALQVGIRFLTHLVKMQAGERAKVECFLLDDLVRIVSGSFKHMSAFGDHEIINDGGRLNVRYTGTSYEHEAAGVLKPKDPRTPSGASGVLPNEPLAETGRWRFSQFIGYMGDFIHMFVTDPGTALGELAQSRAGKFHAHVNQDGSLVVQSLADIVFERVTRIVVPEEQHRPADPEGDKLDGFSVSDTKFLDTWQVNPQKPWELAYHIRDYARWLNSYHAYARFAQMNKDWKIPTEAGSPQPSYGCGEDDKDAAIPDRQRTPRITYSCIRIFRDGSQLLLDGYGGCILQAGGSTVISAPIDVRIEAGRNVSIIAGRNVFMKAHRNVELVAVTGALLAKARTRLSLFCEQGIVLLKTLMKAGPPPDGRPKAERFAQDRMGIVIEAPHANVMLASGNMLTLEGNGNDIQKDKLECGVRVQSGKASIELCTGQEGAVRVRAKAFSTQVSTLVLSCTKAISMLAPFIDFGRLLYKTGGGLVCGTLTARKLLGESIVNGTQIKRGRSPHVNHVAHASVKATPPDIPEEITEELKNKAAPAVSDGLAKTIRTRGEYLSPEEYPIEPSPQSPAQQLATDGGIHPAAVSFEAWPFDQDGEQGDPNAAFKLPYPGPRGKMAAYMSDSILHQPSAKEVQEFKPTAKAAESVPVVFQRWTPPAS
jgi:hypothetical protein